MSGSSNDVRHASNCDRIRIHGKIESKVDPSYKRQNIMFDTLQRQKRQATDPASEIKRNLEFGRRVATVHTRIAAQQRQNTGRNKLDQKVADLPTKWDHAALRHYP